MQASKSLVNTASAGTNGPRTEEADPQKATLALPLSLDTCTPDSTNSTWHLAIPRFSSKRPGGLGAIPRSRPNARNGHRVSLNRATLVFGKGREVRDEPNNPQSSAPVSCSQHPLRCTTGELLSRWQGACLQSVRTSRHLPRRQRPRSKSDWQPPSAAPSGPTAT